MSITAELAGLEGDDLLNYVVEYAYEHETTIADLSLPVQTAYFIANFEAEFYNGGLQQFLTNNSGRFAPETARSFTRIGARQISCLLETSISYDVEKLYKNNGEFILFLRQISQKLHKVYPSNEDGNVGDQLVAYLQENKADILNP
jgi:hypothetical protein